jgi:hypothetical protein
MKNEKISVSKIKCRYDTRLDYNALLTDAHVECKKCGKRWNACYPITWNFSMKKPHIPLYQSYISCTTPINPTPEPIIDAKIK